MAIEQGQGRQFQRWMIREDKSRKGFHTVLSNTVLSDSKVHLCLRIVKCAIHDVWPGLTLGKIFGLLPNSGQAFSGSESDRLGLAPCTAQDPQYSFSLLGSQKCTHGNDVLGISSSCSMANGAHSLHSLILRAIFQWTNSYT